MNTHRNIPIINENFDLQIFTLIIKKSLWISILLPLIAIAGGFLYMRYTNPLYKSISIIQINEENQTNKLLQLQEMDKGDISNKIELLRSKEFLKRTFNKLPLSIRYYSKGTFLSSELYRSAPFEVQAKVSDFSFYGKAIYIEFINIQNIAISYQLNGKNIKKKLLTEQWNTIEGLEINVSLKNFEQIVTNNELLKPNEFYFILKDPQNILEENIKNLTVEILNSNAKTILITYINHNANKTAEVVNTIAEEYIKYDIEKKRESSQNILNFIEDQLKVVYHNLGETEKQLHDFKKVNKLTQDYSGVTAPVSSPFPIFTSKINEFQSEILNIEFELVTLKQIASQLEKDKTLNIYQSIALLSGSKSENIIVSILNTMQNLINQKDEFLNDVTSNNQKIKTIDAQIENQKVLLIDFITATISRLTDQQNDYKSKINEYEKKLFNESTFKEIEFSKLERLYSINEGFYHKLIEKKAEYLISQAGFVSQNEILEKATVPIFPISPIKSKIYLIFILGSIILTGGIIIMRYLFYDEITSVTSIKSYTFCPIIGTVPRYKRKIPVSQLLVNRKPNSMFSESFRSIRSNLQFISNEPGCKTIAVSSTISGEGKTFVAINLAGIMAISGKKVILLDLDLRKPRIHLSFSTENNIGMSTILIGNNSLSECIHPTEIENFYFVTAGPVPPNPNELLLGERMKKILNEAQSLYDVVIIDTPPIGIVTDALNHFQVADYPIYVMKSGFSKRSFIQNINNLAQTKNLPHLSIVLNSIEITGRRYGYGSGANYGYGYEYGYGYGYGYYEEEQQTKPSFLKRMLHKIKEDENDV